MTSDQEFLTQHCKYRKYKEEMDEDKNPIRISQCRIDIIRQGCLNFSIRSKKPPRVQLVISECFDKDVFVLEKDTPAFDASQMANGSGRLSRLPRGAKLRLCGEGVNERMAKVVWNGVTYCVYWRDLLEEIAEPISAL